MQETFQENTQEFEDTRMVEERPLQEKYSEVFSCDICDRRYKSKKSLKEHSVVHSEAKAFICEMCGERFGKKSNYEQHLRTHTGERPFKCNQSGCTKNFARQSSMFRHTKVHHQARPGHSVWSTQWLSLLRYHQNQKVFVTKIEVESSQLLQTQVKRGTRDLPRKVPGYPGMKSIHKILIKKVLLTLFDSSVFYCCELGLRGPFTEEGLMPKIDLYSISKKRR